MIYLENITEIHIIVGAIVVFMMGVFTGYVLGRRIKEKDFIVFSIFFMWLFLVPAAFVFDKEIPGYFDTTAFLVITFYVGVATEKGAEFLQILSKALGKK